MANNYRIIAIAQVYNELRSGNLRRFVKCVKPLVDELVIFDSGSTDSSWSYLQTVTPHLLRSLRNDFLNERAVRQQLLDKALTLKPDFILWLDADEILTVNAATVLQQAAQLCVQENADGVSLHELNLWRSTGWYRTDNAYDDGWFVRLWRVNPKLHFTTSERGLHRQLYPESIRKIIKYDKLQVIHFGFASTKNIIAKYVHYERHGQTGWELSRLIDESTLELKPIDPSLLPSGLGSSSERPLPKSESEWQKEIEVYKASGQQPTVSIVCLIYKSTAWLRFVYEQVLRYTDLQEKEFFFVANDATPAVKQYLRDNYIPHYNFENTPEHKKEWYINNVYRAWNFAAQQAKGEYILFINSDMAFTPGWVERLYEKVDQHNCVASRLVESGKMPSGKFGLSMDFGRSVDAYNEREFQAYAQSISEPKVYDSGLFMPLLIKRSDFLQVHGYPEGNVLPDSDPFAPQIAQKGDVVVSGDVVLMQKLQAIGINHQTAFDSIVYHFQEGEMDDAADQNNAHNQARIIVANDFLNGRMGEKTMWNYLIENLPAAAALDKEIVGESEPFAERARAYLHEHYPKASIVIQNGTFIDSVEPTLCTIAYLQDDLRRMGRKSRQQEINLRAASVLVTNSRLTAASYSEFHFEIIPIGINSNLFRPGNKALARREFNIAHDKRVGIFVGDLSEVKGWPEVRKLIEAHTDLEWIVVSKSAEQYTATHVHMFNKVSQATLAKLYQSADFFILGSQVETQCLAALEACATDVPVLMHLTGIFHDFSPEERNQCGVFTEDLEAGLKKITFNAYSPRKTILNKSLDTEGMVEKWKTLMTRVSMQLAQAKAIHSAPVPVDVPQPQTWHKAQEPWWNQERIKRELSYILPPVIYKALFGTWRKLISAYKRLRN